METIDYQKLFAQLRELIPQLRRNEIKRIIYGDSEDPTHSRQYHQLSIINTLGGLQFAFHQRISGYTGSGDYIGYPMDNEEIIRRAQYWIQYAHRPLLNTAARKWLEQRLAERGGAPELQYFAD